MARSLSFSGTIRFRPTWTEPLDLVDVVDSANLTLSQALANGTAAGQANAYYRDVVTVAAGNTVTIDLTDLTLNVYGGSGTLSLASVKTLLARQVTTTGSVDLSLGTSVTATLGGGDVVYATKAGSGWAETTLTLDNAGGASVDVEIHLLGVAT